MNKNVEVQFLEAQKVVDQIKSIYPKYFDIEKRIQNVTQNLTTWEGIDSEAYKEEIQNYLVTARKQVEYTMGLFNIIEKYIKENEERVRVAAQAIRND